MSQKRVGSTKCAKEVPKEVFQKRMRSVIALWM